MIPATVMRTQQTVLLTTPLPKRAERSWSFFSLLFLAVYFLKTNASVVNIFYVEPDSGSLAGGGGSKEPPLKAHTLSLFPLSPDDRAEEKQAEAWLPRIKHTPCEPSHATTLTPWGHAVTSLSSDARLAAEGGVEMEGQTVAIVEKLLSH